MTEKALRIGTRASLLARAQAAWVQEGLKELGSEAELAIIRTRGDQLSEASLPNIGGDGVFVKELENALLAEEIDLAVHSLKDLPCALPEGLAIAAVPQRANPHDVLCCAAGSTLDTLAGKAKVATSSLRRRAQILAARPDLQIVEVRGNLETRLRKLEEKQFDALIMAAAGLLRAGWEDRISQYLPFEICLPAPGQGALAIEIKSDQKELSKLLAGLNHFPTRTAVEAERAVLSALGGGCFIPLGAIGIVEGENLSLRAALVSPDGRKVLRERIHGLAAQPGQVGQALAEKLFSLGAKEILSSAQHS